MSLIKPLRCASMSTKRSNVIASRIGDEELRVVNMLVEAELFSSRSQAIAYLVREGIKARRDIIERLQEGS